MDRFEARKAATQRLHDDGLIIKSEEIVHKVGTSERSGAVVEPRLSVQWFVKMQELVTSFGKRCQQQYSIHARPI